MEITYQGVNDKTYTVDTDTVPAEALRYLVEYGLKQSLADSVAGLTDAYLAEVHTDNAKWAAFAAKHGFRKGLSPGDAYPYAAEHRQAERFAAILDGTMAVRAGGARLTPLEREIRSLAEARVFAACDAAKPKMKRPTGKALADFIAGIIAKNREALEAQANANIAAREALTVEIDLSSLKVA